MSPNNISDWPEDETLVAFADGRLDAAEAEKVARFLAENADAQRFVEQLVTSGNLAKAAYNAELDTPSNDKLASLILGSRGSGRGSGDEASAGNVVALPKRSPRAFASARYALPLAAAIALVVGAIAGFEFGRRGVVTDGGEQFGIAVGPLGKASPVTGFLETRASGDIVPVSGGATKDARHLMVVASFRDRTGRVCREFEVLANRDEATPLAAAIACRHGDGTWHVEGAAQVAAAPPIPDKDFSPAGSNDASAIEGMLQALGAKPALSKTDEEALLRRGWK